MTKDPVCGMVLDEGRAADLVSHHGKTYLFCSLACRDRFLREPERFAAPPAPLSRPAADRPAIWLGAVLLAAIALFFLWGEHRVHILGWLPWLLLLACPLIHVFMHRGHGHSGHHHHDPTEGGQP